MAVEIERKFLVRHTRMLEGSIGVPMRQAYLARGGVTVRVRLSATRAWLTLKSDTVGIRRAEFEYEIPFADAQALLELSPWPVLSKTRHKLAFAGHVYEVDVFAGTLAPLVVAEVELQHEDEAFAKPEWLGSEVTHDPQYRNSELVLRLAAQRASP